MARNAVRSGVTFDKSLYDKLDSIVKSSKRFKIDKSEIINALLDVSKLSIKQIQQLVMNYREKSSKDVIRSGVTFDSKNYSKLTRIISESKRFRIDKSEIVNAIIQNLKFSLKLVQKLVMDYRETR